MTTKRHLGIVLLLVGVAAVVATLAIDWLGVGAFRGIGPAQELGLLAGLVIAIVGLSLIPFGDRPA